MCIAVWYSSSTFLDRFSALHRTFSHQSEDASADTVAQRQRDGPRTFAAQRLTTTHRGADTVAAQRAKAAAIDSLRGQDPDACLAAAALEIGPAVIASFDKDLDAVEGVRRISG